MKCCFCKNNIGSRLICREHRFQVQYGTYNTLFGDPYALSYANFDVFVNEDRFTFTMLFEHKKWRPKNEFIIYHFPFGEATRQTFYQSDRIPTDLTPETAMRFLQRLFDLKAFL